MIEIKIIKTVICDQCGYRSIHVNPKTSDLNETYKWIQLSVIDQPKTLEFCSKDCFEKHINNVTYLKSMEKNHV